MPSFVETLASTLTLGSLLELLHAHVGRFDLVAHHAQGEFHHDVILRVAQPPSLLPGPVLVVATNCNGGVKEVLCFADVPDPLALWHARCPEIAEFEGEIPPLLEEARTLHWFEPCELLSADARSELRPEHRTRQRGGGSCPRA